MRAENYNLEKSLHLLFYKLQQGYMHKSESKESIQSESEVICMKQQKFLRAHTKMEENNHEAEMLVQAFHKASAQVQNQSLPSENINNVHGMSSTELQEAAALAKILNNGVE